jgi:hypothetical protein
MLNTAVSVDEFDPKWRLLRLILETETPGWLGLSTHVQEDKAFLDRQLATEKPIEFGNSVNETPYSWVKFYMKLK